MAKLVTIFGGSGFLGRYVASRMAREGWRVRVAVRLVNEAIFVRTYGSPGQVEPVFCNIRDDASVHAVTKGADAVINCVGILDSAGKNTFEAVHADGAERIARIAAIEGVGRMVHISAIGADVASPSEYFRTKAKGEAAVLQFMSGAVVLRPSVLFGPEDQFFNRFAGMTRFSLALPIVGAETMFQPAYVDDVAAATVAAVVGNASGIYELGGPDKETFRALMQRMLRVIRRRRLIVGMPFWAGRFMGMGFGLMQKLSLGIVKAPVTTDQVKRLGFDNVVAEGAKGFSELGIDPIAMDVVLPEYLWRFRPSGQFLAIKESASNLKT